MAHAIAQQFSSKTIIQFSMPSRVGIPNCLPSSLINQADHFLTVPATQQPWYAPGGVSTSQHLKTGVYWVQGTLRSHNFKGCDNLFWGTFCTDHVLNLMKDFLMMGQI